MSGFAFHARLFFLNNRFFFLKSTESLVIPVPCQHPSDRVNITLFEPLDNNENSYFYWFNAAQNIIITKYQLLTLLKWWFIDSIKRVSLNYL